MASYCVKRLLQSIVSIFIITSLVFLLLRLMPISGYFQEGSWVKMSWEAKVAVLQKLGIYGVDKQPINPFIQLANYYKTVFTTGNFGESMQLYKGKQVVGIIADKFPITMAFSSSAFILSLFLGFVLGVLMAWYKNSPIDHLGMIYIVIVNSVPPLVYYFIIQYWVTKWVSPSMIYRTGIFPTFIAPVLCIMVGPIAANALWIRRYMVDEINKDYVKLAYAKGLPSRTVMFRHILRNAFIPTTYTIPIAFTTALSGSLIMERLFSVPGMGRLLVDAISKRDNNFVQTLVILYAALGLLSVFLGDIFAMLADPRIKLTDRGGVR